MLSPKYRSILASIFFVFSQNAASASTIEVPLEGTLSGFGSTEVYRGQTFFAPAEPVSAEQLTVYVGPTSDFGADFRVLLTEVDRSGGFSPGTVLFESETLNVSPLPPRVSPDAFEVILGGINLLPGREYAWILDHFVVANGFVSMDTGISFDPTTPGEAFGFVNGPFLPPGSREDHFEPSTSWFTRTSLDFSYKLEYSETAVIPLPPTMPLFAGALLLIGSLGAVRRRRIGY